MNKILITGSAGFIGFHLAKTLLDQDFIVHGFDGFTDYYDVNLKKARHNILLNHSNYSYTIGMLEEQLKLDEVANKFGPQIIIHLAAQAGVRYSKENPRSYINSNIVGTFNVMEIARKLKVKHLLMASTSSVYGASTNMPFSEVENTDYPLTIYSASKKAIEAMAHSYSYLWNVPTSILRFFTVYGPWGRPDMALFKFVEAILNNKPIDLFNYGEMSRDFTYIQDLVKAIFLLVNSVPQLDPNIKKIDCDSLSSVAPFRTVNIGNSKTVNLHDFINSIENILKKKAVINNLPMQKGDVKKTLSDTTLLKNLTNFTPDTDYKEGISSFIDWYKDYYKI